MLYLKRRSQRTIFKMKNKNVHRWIGVFRDSFKLRETPSSSELSDLFDSVWRLEFDGIASGKANMRNDLKRVGHDFKNATSEAGRKLKEEGCLSY